MLRLLRLRCLRHRIADRIAPTSKECVVIPKPSQQDRIQGNYAALDIALSEADLNALDQAFPPPVRLPFGNLRSKPQPLSMI